MTRPPTLNTLTSVSFLNTRDMLNTELLILLALANMLRVPGEVDRQRQLGENCRTVLAWCREHDIGRFDEICVETTPAGLLNGFGAMLDLFLGKPVYVHDLLTVRRPPFLIHGVPDHIHSEGEKTRKVR